jgi:hypothetical protein
MKARNDEKEEVIDPEEVVFLRSHRNHMIRPLLVQGLRGNKLKAH